MVIILGIHMKTDRNYLDYLIVNTGYTSRLIKLLGFDKVELIKENAFPKGTYTKDGHNNVYKVGYTFDYRSQEGVDKIRNSANKWRRKLDEAFTFYDRPGGVLPDEYIEAFDDFINSCVYIYDDLWGNGLYKISNENDEINKVMSILDAHKIEKNGTVCFICKERDDIALFTNIIKKLEYCRTFDYLGDRYVDSDDLVITVASFDTESG